MVSQNEVLTKDQANIAGYRQNRGYQADVLVYGDVTISFSAIEVRRGGQLVALTRKEFKTLAYFLKNARRVISRDELLNEVWGYEFYPSPRTVDNHENRTTGNWVVAAYTHDTSRELDPQLHTHAVAANLTYDGVEGLGRRCRPRVCTSGAAI